MALCACCSPEFNNGFWGFKTLLWAVLFIATLFITNDVFDTTGYVWVARIGAFIFTIMQQIVLIDLAYRCVCVRVCMFGFVSPPHGHRDKNHKCQHGIPFQRDEGVVESRGWNIATTCCR